MIYYIIYARNNIGKYNTRSRFRQTFEDNNYHNKSKTIVPYEELEKELYKMNKVLKAYDKRNLNNEEEDY